MKYIAVIDTDDYENFEFFEDATGKYLAVRDMNAKSGEMMALQFKQAPGKIDNYVVGDFQDGYNSALIDCEVLEDDSN